MASSYSRVANARNSVEFVSTATAPVERSVMNTMPTVLTTFNAGDIVPIYYEEVLPYSTWNIDVDFVIRQNTLKTPTMGTMTADLYAFFVPNRIINESWKTVFGENPNGAWSVEPISLAPLFAVDSSVPSSYSTIQINVGSPLDYYGFPTQAPIPKEVLSSCNDLKIRGYIEIYNEYFRDQNYQPPIPYSKLNVYEGFIGSNGPSPIGLNVGWDSFTTANYDIIQGNAQVPVITAEQQDNSLGGGAVSQAVYGNAQSVTSGSQPGYIRLSARSSLSTFDANGSLLRANKLHDYFTSVLPSPQKSATQVFVPVSFEGENWVRTSTENMLPVAGTPPIRFEFNSNPSNSAHFFGTASVSSGASPDDYGNRPMIAYPDDTLNDNSNYTYPTNLYADIQNAGISLEDLRMSAAVQQVYEQLARSGSRYRSYIRGFFSLEVDDPFLDIPCYLGHIRRDLELFQTAQTAPSQDGSTPQGNLAAFGYTNSGGHLVRDIFYEHGYLHVFCVVRHRNVYSSYMARDNFRMTMLDWYQPQLANISEQPVYSREINPFLPASQANAAVFGYQEAWAEYRFDPDRVSGLMRPGISDSLAVWNYADDFNSALVSASGEWLKSNSKQVLDRTLAVTSEVSHQFKGQFRFKIRKELPMPVYSVPGLDIV